MPDFPAVVGFPVPAVPDWDTSVFWDVLENVPLKPVPRAAPLGRPPKVPPPRGVSVFVPAPPKPPPRGPPLKPLPLEAELSDVLLVWVLSLEKLPPKPLCWVVPLGRPPKVPPPRGVSVFAPAPPKPPPLETPPKPPPLAVSLENPPPRLLPLKPPPRAVSFVKPPPRLLPPKPPPLAVSLVNPPPRLPPLKPPPRAVSFVKPPPRLGALPVKPPLCGP